jgi:hypothetical protein
VAVGVQFHSKVRPMVVVVPQVHEQKPCDGSFVRIPSDKLTQMALKSLDNIKVYKARDRKELANRERKELLARREKKRNSIWSKIFGYKEQPMPTDEELIKMHEQSGDGIWLPETVWIDFRYQKNIEVAYRLINAAKHADEVAVSTKDLERLL